MDLIDIFFFFSQKRKLTRVKAPAKIVMFYLENDHMVVS